MEEPEAERLEEDRQRALAYFQEAYQHQMNGSLKEAIAHYKKSIALYPTAEAHTFLGWTYSFLGRLEEAIAECHKAIQVDPDFGNPYNDIGAYLIELGRLDEAIPWLEKATHARRYEARAYPYMNLGRIYQRKAHWFEALRHYRRAMEIDPQYGPAYDAWRSLQSKMN